MRPHGSILWSLGTVGAAFLILMNGLGSCETWPLLLSCPTYAPIQWNATLAIPIVPDAIRSSLASTSATAASLLVAVIAFLYNILRTLRQQDQDSYSRYQRTRSNYQQYVSENLKRSSYTLRPRGGAGTKGDFDFEWACEIYSPVTTSVARPKTMLADFHGLFRSYVDVSLVDSVNRKQLYDFSNEKWIDLIISEPSTADVRVVLLWVFDKLSTGAGVLHVQTIYLSLLATKMQSLTRSLRMMSIAVALFVATIALSFVSEFLNGSAYLALLAYSLGWGLVLLGVRQVLSLVPSVLRSQKTAPPEGDIVIEVPAKDPKM